MREVADCLSEIKSCVCVCVCRKDHEKAEFEVHEVYAVDVLISTGEGKVRVIRVLLSHLLLRLSIPSSKSLN